MCTDKEMPKYQCTKKVWGLKIAAIDFSHDEDEEIGAIITPENTDYLPFNVSQEYVKKHNPEAGGYYVMYKGGYKSFSPAKPFEEGNILITSEENIMK